MKSPREKKPRKHPPVTAPVITVHELPELFRPYLPARAIATVDWFELAEWLNTVRDRISVQVPRKWRNATATKAAVRLRRELHKVQQSLGKQIIEPPKQGVSTWVRSPVSTDEVEIITSTISTAAVAGHLEVEQILQAIAFLDRLLPILDPQRSRGGKHAWGPDWEGPGHEVLLTLEKLFVRLGQRVGREPGSPLVLLAVAVLGRLGFPRLEPEALVQLGRRRRAVPLTNEGTPRQ